jgi:DNA-binding transcriptional LysR family regulator
MKQNFTMRQGALDGVEAFLSVARHKSFRRAASDLGVTPSAVSQTIRALETRIGAALFLRTTRSVGLTEAGERFLTRAKPAFDELVAASQVARNLGQRPSGLLRLAVPPGALPVLGPLMAGFSREFPEVEVEIAASGELIDATAQGFDAGVRLGQFIAADMVTVRLTSPSPLTVVASADYLARHKAPRRIDDLRGHRCLRMRRSNGAIAPWIFLEGNKRVEAIVAGPLIAGDTVTLLGGAIDGMGLAQLPELVTHQALRMGKLVRLLKPFEPTAPGLYLYYPSRHQMMPKLRAFVDHVKQQTAARKRNLPASETH